jgi:DNA-binding GntR family transcriptional regulator
MAQRNKGRIVRDEVLTALRRSITDREISPGSKLIEEDLAHEFGVSRSVIRGVLSDLEAQGLVEKKPHKGTVVCKIDLNAVFEILEIREVLEGLSARLAAQKTTADDWKDLEQKFGEPCEQIVKNRDYEEYLALITDFRKRTVEAAQNKELSRLIDSIYAKIRIVQRRIIILPGRIEQAINEHRTVIRAIMEGNPAKAEKMKRSNLRSAREYLKKYEKWVL